MKKNTLLIFLIILGLFVLTGCNKNEKIKLVENKDYYVRGEFTGKYLDITKRGYYISSLDQPSAPYDYIICMGEENTEGYSLKIKEVNKVGERTEVIVEEIVPDKNEVVSTAIIYPTIIVEFPNYQDNIIIKNTNGEEFNELKDY